MCETGVSLVEVFFGKLGNFTVGIHTGSKTRSRPLQCNSSRYTSALNYHGESHHSLRSIDPAPNPTLRID